MTLWHEVRGDGEPLLVLLHGLNATSAAWEPFDALIAETWPGRRLLIDLPGHGRSDALPEYSFGVIAAEVSRVIAPLAVAPVVLLGHSMGAVVALTLGSGWFGIPLDRVLSLGIKVAWSPEELDGVASAGKRAVKWYERQEEAEERFVRLAGLEMAAASMPQLLAGGVSSADGKFRVAADPRASSIGPPSMESMVPAASVPVRLACGDRDPMVKIEQLRPFDPHAVEIPDAGHNAHVENPAALARLL